MNAMNLFQDIQFHWYGFFVGLAAVIGWWLVDAKLERIPAYKKNNQQLIFWLLIGVDVLIGARLWHVFTDWHLYQSNPESILYIWNGGLSIVGAVMGGLVGVFEWWLVVKRKASIAAILDTFVFGLPLAQAIGRVGNFINQELYGWPSSLPWAIPISKANRLENIKMAETFHPLFFYETVAVLLFWVWARWWSEDSKEKSTEKNNGVLFAAYVVYYAAIRFALDFFRPDRGVLHTLSSVQLGSNQLIMVAWLVGGLVGWWYVWRQQPQQQHMLRMVTIMAAAWIIVATMWGSPYAQAQSQRWGVSSSNEGSEQSKKPLALSDLLDPALDHKKVAMEVLNSDYDLALSDSAPLAHLEVEVVNSPVSMTQGLSDRMWIGSDGMLFVFPQAKKLTFWMKRMHFDLDMVWIKDSRIIGINPNIPAPPVTTPESELLTYPSPGEADAILEVPAGTAERLGLEQGMEVQYNTL